MITDPKRQKEFERAYFVELRRLPTIETQVVECFRLFQEFGREFRTPYTWNSIDLRRAPFQLYARSGFWTYNDRPLVGFAIENIGVTSRFQGRGWFRNFSEIIYHTMPHDLLVIENVGDPELNQALRRKREYHRFRVDCFARSELFSEGFDARLLRPSHYRKFKELGGQIKAKNFSAALSKHSADGKIDRSSLQTGAGANPLDWYGDCPPDAEPSPILQAIIAPHTLHGLSQRNTRTAGTEAEEAE